MTEKILFINGPNLKLLSTRQPELYGSTTLSDIESNGRRHAESLGAELESFQSNHEGAIVERIHAARNEVDAIVINPAAFTYTSVAIRDTLLGVWIPFVEIHITNTHAREQFRHHSLISDKAEAVIMGLGAFGYVVAIEHAVKNVSLNGNETTLNEKAEVRDWRAGALESELRSNKE
jgi:3-dehydroquinate dehydratase-2